MNKHFIATIIALTESLVISSSPVVPASPITDVIVEVDLPRGENPTEYATTCAQYTTDIISDSEYGYIYDTLLCGFHLTLPERSLDILEGLGFVSDVYDCAEYEMLSYSETENALSSSMMIGYDAAEKAGLTGDGVRIAVIDSGFDVTHPAFDTEVSDTVSLKKYASVTGPNRLNAMRHIINENALRHSSKIPFRFDYADNDTNVYSEETHGTHVAGIIGAAANEENGMYGIAPKSQLLLMKIFSDESQAAYDYALLAALEDAVKLNTDVVNLSLGQYAGSTNVNTIIGLDKIIERAEMYGTVVVCAVGNDGVSTSVSKLAGEQNIVYPPTSYTDYGTLSFPSTTDYPLSVTSVDNFVLFRKHFRHAENEAITPEFSDTNLVGGVLTESFTEHFDGKTIEYVVIPGIGEEQDYNGLDLTGKLALIERGVITFAEKANTAAAHGAVGVIIYNNINEESLDMDLTGAKIPAIAISLEDGISLKNESTHKVKFSTDYTAINQSATAGKISDFSSIGCTPSLTLKPEISGVGGGVLSSVNGGGYEGAAGTSMAAPQISGVCALYIENEIKNGVIGQVGRAGRIKNALMNSADLILQDNGIEYSPRSQGAGLVNIPELLNREIEITYSSNGKAKAELFDNLGDKISFDVDIKNLTSSPLDVHLSATLTSDGYTEIQVNEKTAYYNTLEAVADTTSVITANGVGNINRYTEKAAQYSMTLSANETKTVNITINLDKDYHTALDEVFTNGHFAEGFIICKTANTSASIPYMGYVGDWCKASVIDTDFYSGEKELFNATKMLIQYQDRYSIAGVNFFADPDITDASTIAFSPNGDGIADTIHLAATNIRNVRNAVFTVNDSDGNEIDRKEYNYISKTSTSDGTVVFKLTWKGTDRFNERYKLPDGKYTMNATYTLDYGENNTQTYSFPFTLDTTAPTVTDISLDGDELKISAEDENGIFAICVYANENEKGDDIFEISSDAAFDISNYEGDYLYYDVIDYAYNIRVGRIKLADLAE